MRRGRRMLSDQKTALRPASRWVGRVPDRGGTTTPPRTPNRSACRRIASGRAQMPISSAPSTNPRSRDSTPMRRKRVDWRANSSRRWASPLTPPTSRSWRTNGRRSPVLHLLSTARRPQSNGRSRGRATANCPTPKATRSRLLTSANSTPCRTPRPWHASRIGAGSAQVRWTIRAECGQRDPRWSPVSTR